MSDESPHDKESVRHAPRHRRTCPSRSTATWPGPTRARTTHWGSTVFRAAPVAPRRALRSDVDQAMNSRILPRPRGAYVMGRNMYGPVRGAWGDAAGGEMWRGWWGDDPPYHAPVFVLTHHPHDPVEMEGGTTFHFVDGFHAPRWRRLAAAGDQTVHHRLRCQPRSARDSRPAWSTRSCSAISLGRCSAVVSGSSKDLADLKAEPVEVHALAAGDPRGLPLPLSPRRERRRSSLALWPSSMTAHGHAGADPAALRAHDAGRGRRAARCRPGRPARRAGLARGRAVCRPAAVPALVPPVAAPAGTATSTRSG